MKFSMTPLEGQMDKAVLGQQGVSRLKTKTVRAGAVTIMSQSANFALYTISTIVLGRLLGPADYGLVGMVTAVTGFLAIFKDGGLSHATVQRDVITHEQVSTLFWINLGLGMVLALVCAALAPALASFYREPKLVGITLGLSGTFICGAAAVQHYALLRRELRFKALAAIDMAGTILGVGAGIVMAMGGMGYWALVGIPIVTVVIQTAGAWLALPWRPGPPHRGCDVQSLLRFGGLLTSTNAVNYCFRNLDNVLIGWRWGAGPLGLYQKAYSLLMLPISQVNFPLSSVAVSALSRVQMDPVRLRRYFLAGYTMAASLIMPIVCVVAVFADDIILFMLGPKWSESVAVFRLLAPAGLIGALLNPLGWLYIAMGRSGRQFKITCFWSALIILSFAGGLHFGARGVATAYSAMSCVLAFPVLLYGVYGTPIRVRDMMVVVLRPAGSATLAGLSGLILKAWLPGSWPVGIRAIVGCSFVMGAYAFVLLVIMGQWHVYLDFFRQVTPGKQPSGRPGQMEV